MQGVSGSSPLGSIFLDFLCRKESFLFFSVVFWGPVWTEKFNTNAKLR